MQIKKTSKVQWLFFPKIDISLVYVFQYTYLSNPFFSNFWGVGLETLSNSLFFGDPQNWSPLGPAFKKRDNISEFKKILILYRPAFCAGAKTIQDRASVHT